jgi:ribosomal protein S18 acetylase RimI-like enzyme
MIRPASLRDLGELERLENASFRTDRIRRRQFRHLLTRGNCVTLVDSRSGGVLVGYAMVLFRRGAARARLYSIAVDPGHRGRGIGAGLLRAAEAAARRRAATHMRLEVRAADSATQALYVRKGYRRFGLHARYYGDDMDAVRMEKRLAPSAAG